MSPKRSTSYPFRPWVRRTCRRAMYWGIGVVALLGGISWVLSTPASAHAGRAFGVLLAYGLLFWVTLAKIWWTAGHDAVALAPDALSYQPLHAFRPKRLPFARVLGCAPRPGTQALRFVYRDDDEVEREFFLNLGVVDGRNDFLELLGRHLASHGLRPVAGKRNAWRDPDWARPW